MTVSTLNCFIGSAYARTPPVTHLDHPPALPFDDDFSTYTRDFVKARQEYISAIVPQVDRRAAGAVADFDAEVGHSGMVAVATWSKSVIRGFGSRSRANN